METKREENVPETERMLDANERENPEEFERIKKIQAQAPSQEEENDEEEEEEVRPKSKRPQSKATKQTKRRLRTKEARKRKSATGAKKPHRYRPGTVALREIRRYQRSTRLDFVER